jgi:hypothetical protein
VAFSIAWTAYLLEFHGFDVKIFGIKITTHQPAHPVGLAVAALVVFFVTNGFRRLTEIWSTIAEGDDRAIAGLLAIVTTAVGLTFSTMAATGSDAYGYVSEADSWRAGKLTTAQPWVRDVPWPDADRSFAPLGYLPQTAYRRGADPTTIVPTYAPGLPMLMAAAQLIGGHCAAFWIVPLSGGLLVLATYGLGRRLGSSRAGLIAAWLVATSPAFLYMLMWPMTDVPVAAAWTVALYLVFGASWRHVIAAGLAVAMAVLIRPNLAPLAAVPLLWLAVRAWRSTGAARSRAMGQAVAFLAAVAPGPIALLVINWRLYGSPLQSGYADAAGFFDRSHILPNLQHYASWLIDSQTPFVLVGVAALFLPLRWLWPQARDRSMLVAGWLVVLGVVAFYAPFLEFDAWWYLRFLLPCWPFIMLGLGAVGVAVTRQARPMLGPAVAIAVLVLGVRGVRVASDRFAFELWQGEHRYVTAAKLTETATDPNSVIFSIQHSGSVRYYAGRVSVRFDSIERGWLDRAVDWLAERGVHSYLLVEDWEIPTFRQMFAGQRTVGRVDMPPVFVYSGPATILLYDLVKPPGARAAVDTMVETYRGARCLPPAPPGRLVLKP